MFMPEQSFNKIQQKKSQNSFQLNDIKPRKILCSFLDKIDLLYFQL